MPMMVDPDDINELGRSYARETRLQVICYPKGDDKKDAKNERATQGLIVDQHR